MQILPFFRPECLEPCGMLGGKLVSISQVQSCELMKNIQQSLLPLLLLDKVRTTTEKDNLLSHNFRLALLSFTLPKSLLTVTLAFCFFGCFCHTHIQISSRLLCLYSA